MDSNNDDLSYDFSNPRPYGRYTSKTSLLSLPSLPSFNGTAPRRNLSDIEYEFDENEEQLVDNVEQVERVDFGSVSGIDHPSPTPYTDSITNLPNYVEFDLASKHLSPYKSPERNFKSSVDNINLTVSPDKRNNDIISLSSDIKPTNAEYPINSSRKVISPASTSGSLTNSHISNSQLPGSRGMIGAKYTVNSLEEAEHKADKAIESNAAVNTETATTSNPTNNKENGTEEDDFFSSTSDWKTMQTISEFDYYNDRGELAYTQNGVFDHSGAGSRGYTKIDTEAQVAKYAAMNKKTDFLFVTTDVLENPEDHHDEDSDNDNFDEGEETMNSLQTLESTKNMLEDSQKIAYSAIVRLIQFELAKDLALLKTVTSPKASKKLALSQQSMGNWTQITSKKLYDHLGLREEERSMIDKLLGHGLEVSDLTSSLTSTTSTLNNGNKKDSLDSEKLVWILICDLFLLLLEDGYYDSRSRTLLVQFAKSLNVEPIEVFQFERRLIESLDVEAEKAIGNKDELLSDRTYIERRIKRNRKRRLAYIGLATLGGGLAIGLSAGLLAPVIGAGIAAGLTTIGIGGTSGFLVGIGGSAIITTTGVLTGVKVGSKAGSRRTGEVETFELKPLHDNKRTNLVLTVSGWMNGELDDVRLPFLTLDPVVGDLFSLLWEPEMLQLMGQTIGILALEALLTSIQQILGATILTTLMSAIQLPMALLKLSYLLDNPWNVSLTRAWKAGKILADTLLSGNLGVRPVTLVGFLLGARLIFSCLIEMAKRGGFGIIQDVIILGTPITVNADEFALARSVVSGRFVNGYSRKDWILGYLFRATGGGLKSVAGLTEIEGVENLDCTEFVEGHMLYRKAIPRILKELDWEVLLEEFEEIEEPDPEQRERQRKLVNEFDELRAQMEKEGGPKRKGWKKWFQPKRKNWWDTVAGDGNGEEGKNEGTNAKDSDSAGNTTVDPNEEYEIEASGPIFDVGALLEEVKEIEQMVNDGPKEEEGIEKKTEVNSTVSESVTKVSGTKQDRDDKQDKESADGYLKEFNLKQFKLKKEQKKSQDGLEEGDISDL